MKIQCNACEAAEAAVLCCADEAALCWACDDKVHAANKLAGKHQRVLLISPEGSGKCSSSSSFSCSSSSRVPKCDICQEAAGFFFCLEDRALLCRKCDVTIHTANVFVSAHQRFLLTGVRVGLESTEPISTVPKEQPSSAVTTVEQSIDTITNRTPAVSSYRETNEVFTGQMGKNGLLATNKTSFPDAATPRTFIDWPLENLFALTDFSQNFGFMEHGSSKTDSGKFGSSDDSYRSTDEELDADECLGQVPEIQWIVPGIPSPPTASGLHWPKSRQNPTYDNTCFVPDICVPMEVPHRQHGKTTKRRRL